ncbi:MAG: hypothetical protein D6698_02750 [Gammaproteobacteria bacterium]|nr:MAG: hypothetical protein D6698_02750 [Gammaproteobacteria bacterium]
MTIESYKLPEGWRWVRLGRVCEHARNFLDPRNRPDDDYCLYSIPAYDKDQSPEHLKGREIGSIKLVVEQGVCLFSKLNPRIPRAWIVSQRHCSAEGVASTEFMPLKPAANELSIDYLGKLLLTETFLQQFRRDISGSTGSRKRLKPEVVLDSLIPLPPLAEQRRIVARIEELMERIREARRLREHAREDAERLWQSVLADTFPRPGSDLPSGWRWVRLGEVCEIFDRLRKPVKKKDRVPGEIPYCGANGIIDYVEGFTHEGEFVLLAEDGGFYGSGEPSAYVMQGRFWANNHVHIIRGKSGLLLNQLLRSYLVATDLKPFLTGATRPKLTQGAMLSIPIPLPPLDEQRRIVAHLEAVQEKICALKAAQAETDEQLKRLELSILDKAFRGEL